MKYQHISAPIITIKDPKTGVATPRVAKGISYVRKGLRAVDVKRLERVERRELRVNARMDKYIAEHSHG